MLLTGNNIIFELNIVNYEFPKADTSWDADWLNIEIIIKSNKRSWKATQPMLLTWEIKLLIKWLEEIAINKGNLKELYFVEPNLKFIKLNKTKDNALIRVYFELEACPKWAESNMAGEEDLWVDLTPSIEELNKAIQNLKNQSKKFPVRIPV